MNKLLTLIATVIISTNVLAQAPQKMSYQAVIRNGQNELVFNKLVGIRISILQGGTQGTSVYSELHSATTNANGLVSIEIGEGTNKTGTFSSINWGNGTYFLKTETDPTNGTNYSIVATSQLLSVPYALESKNASSAGDGIKGISQTGDTVFLNNGKKYIIPGIRDLNPPPTIDNGLVGYWPFNGNTNDESGNGNNGATVGNPIYSTGRNTNSNNSFFFNGSTYVRIPHKAQLNCFPITLSTWFKSSAAFPSYIIAKYENATWAGYGLAVEPNGTGFYLINRNNAMISGYDNYPEFKTPQALNDGIWHHLVLVADEVSGKLYLDGKLTDTQLWRGTPQPTLNNWPLIFGYYPTNFASIGGTFDPYFNGHVDDIRIYNRALTQEEITWLANN
jgi:hypothetical protein